MMNISFPKDFLWGAAASGPQTEGTNLQDGKSLSTWDVWFEKEPEKFHHQIGPGTTSGVYEHYEEDVRLMAEMGLNSYRTSIQWTRLLPDGKELNTKAVDFYRKYFSCLREYGVTPIINLFHFDMPWWMMEQGGWENPDIINHFAYYSKIAFETFGDIVDYWATFNEPMVHIECGYLGDAHLPRVNDFKRAVQVGYHTLMAHFVAVREYRKTGQAGKIGTILNLSPVYAKSESPADEKAAFYGDLIQVRSLLDPIVHNDFPEALVNLLDENDLLPELYIEHKELLNQSIDFLGVNYYQPLRVQAPDGDRLLAQSGRSALYKGYDWPGKKINKYRGWEIYEKGIYDISKRIQNDYKNLPWFISENGMGVADEGRFINDKGIVEDTYRIEFIKDHLCYLNKSIQEGSSCFGYHLWTFVDCWSWLNSYKNRYGFVRIDLDDNLKRTRKLSSYWMEEVIKNNGFNLEV